MELKNLERELSRFRSRSAVAGVFMLTCFGLLVARLTWLQVVKHDDLATQAESNRIVVVPIVPNRGLIVDRNGVVLASNYSAYTLEIKPSEVADLDETIDELAKIVQVSASDRRRFMKMRKESKSFESLPLRSRLSDEEVARFTAQRFRFPGVEIKARLFRNYPFGEVASHVIGYIGRINPTEKQQMEEEWSEDDLANYRGTDYIGKLGIEQRYEKELHGIAGVEEVETTAGGRAVRPLASTKATPGNTVHLSIDIKLQAMVERLFGERRGALVAIDPNNGEVLAFVSKPTFDPNLFVDGIDSESWKDLVESIDKPLLNRALRGTYPPGSTFKPFMGYAGLATGKRTAEQQILDNGVFIFGNRAYKAPADEQHGMFNLHRAIALSSNVYFYALANDMGVDSIYEQLSPFGLGGITGIDLKGEVSGVLPSTEWKRNYFKRPEQKKWHPGDTISLGIGQGFNNFTMLQMANATGILSSGGLRFRPRLVREVEDAVSRDRKQMSAEALPTLALDPKHVEVVKQAMYGVTVEGTSRRVFAGAPYLSGGKTGTAQAVSLKKNEKYNAAKMAEHQRDHSLYIAFAPLDKPRIAVAVIVENAGFGAQHAAPIARRVLDYWVSGTYPSEEDFAASQLGQAGAPIGIQRQVKDVPLPGQQSVQAGSPASAAPSAAASGPSAASGSAGATPQPAASQASSGAGASRPASASGVGSPMAASRATSASAAKPSTPSPAPAKPVTPTASQASAPAPRPQATKPAADPGKPAR